MTEGKGTKSFSVAKKLLFADPAFSHALLARSRRQRRALSRGAGRRRRAGAADL
jgi:hypothetical protein